MILAIIINHINQARSNTRTTNSENKTVNAEQANMLLELKETQQKAENLGFAMTFFTPNELQYTDSIQFKSALEQQSCELLAIFNEDYRIVRENDLGGFM